MNLPTVAFDKAQSGDWEGALNALFEAHPDITSTDLTLLKGNLRKVPLLVKTVGELKVFAKGKRTWASIHSYDLGIWFETMITRLGLTDDRPVSVMMETATKFKNELYGPNGLLDLLAKVYIPAK